MAPWLSLEPQFLSQLEALSATAALELEGV
jgi:hypothetical protein